jgi:hypothetical protein
MLLLLAVWVASPDTFHKNDRLCKAPKQRTVRTYADILADKQPSQKPFHQAGPNVYTVPPRHVTQLKQDSTAHLELQQAFDTV